jgi:hypothetical protein
MRRRQACAPSTPLAGRRSGSRVERRPRSGLRAELWPRWEPGSGRACARVSGPSCGLGGSPGRVAPALGSPGRAVASVGARVGSRLRSGLRACAPPLVDGAHPSRPEPGRGPPWELGSDREARTSSRPGTALPRRRRSAAAPIRGRSRSPAARSPRLPGATDAPSWLGSIGGGPREPTPAGLGPASTTIPNLQGKIESQASYLGTPLWMIEGWLSSLTAASGSRELGWCPSYGVWIGCWSRPGAAIAPLCDPGPSAGGTRGSSCVRATPERALRLARPRELGARWACVMVGTGVRDRPLPVVEPPEVSARAPRSRKQAGGPGPGAPHGPGGSVIETFGLHVVAHRGSPEGWIEAACGRGVRDLPASVPGAVAELVRRGWTGVSAERGHGDGRGDGQITARTAAWSRRPMPAAGHRWCTPSADGRGV